MWTNKPDHRTTIGDAVLLTLLFVAMYGELRSGFIGTGTIMFAAYSWWLSEEPPRDYVV